MYPIVVVYWDPVPLAQNELFRKTVTWAPIRSFFATEQANGSSSYATLFLPAGTIFFPQDIHSFSVHLLPRKVGMSRRRLELSHGIVHPLQHMDAALQMPARNSGKVPGRYPTRTHKRFYDRSPRLSPLPSSVFSFISRGLAPTLAQKRFAPAIPPSVQGSCVQLPRTVLGIPNLVIATIWAIRSSLIDPLLAITVPGIPSRRNCPTWNPKGSVPICETLWAFLRSNPWF